MLVFRAVLQFDLGAGGDLIEDLGLGIGLAGIFLGDALERLGILLLIDGMALQAAFLLGQRLAGSGIGGEGERRERQRGSEAQGACNQGSLHRESPEIKEWSINLE